jgi:hypothetical protein
MFSLIAKDCAGRQAPERAIEGLQHQLARAPAIARSGARGCPHAPWRFCLPDRAPFLSSDAPVPHHD